MNALLNGFDTNEATFRTMTKLSPNRAVALSSDGTLFYPLSGKFTGILTSCKDNIGSVVMRGYAVAEFKSTVPSVGICNLAPTPTGYMEVDDTNGKPYTVVGVDLINKTIEFIL